MAETRGIGIRHKAEIEAFGLRVRRLRGARKLSQQALADIADLSRPTIQRIEKGTVPANLDVLLALAKALEIELYELLKL